MALERKRSSRRGPHSGATGPLNRARRKPENKCKTCCRKFTAFLFSHVGLCVLVVVYSLLGAFAFRALEAPHEEEKASQVIKLRHETVHRLWDITMELNVLYRKNWTRLVTQEMDAFQRDLMKAIRDGYDGKDVGTGTQWSFSGAFLYSLTVITTIGYGNIAPRTPLGKVMTIFYAILGIPLMLLYLTNIGDILAKSFRYVYGRVCVCKGSESSQAAQRRRRHLAAENYRVHHIVSHNSSGHNSLEPGVQDKLHVPSEDEVRIETLTEEDLEIEKVQQQQQRISVPITLCLVIMVSYISGGAIIFSLWEGWNFLDGSYFCFVTLSTIGFGDLVPGDSVISDSGSQEKLVICSLYLLVGMALIAMCFNLMQEEVINKIRNCGKKIGILKAEDEDEDMG